MQCICDRHKESCDCVSGYRDDPPTVSAILTWAGEVGLYGFALLGFAYIVLWLVGLV